MAPLLAGIRGSGPGNEQVLSVRPIRESRMSQELGSETPMLKHFFPGLLPPIGAESYKQVVAGYRELLSNHERPNDHAL